MPRADQRKGKHKSRANWRTPVNRSRSIVFPAMPIPNTGLPQALQMQPSEFSNRYEIVTKHSKAHGMRACITESTISNPVFYQDAFIPWLPSSQRKRCEQSLIDNFPHIPSSCTLRVKCFPTRLRLLPL